MRATISFYRVTEKSDSLLGTRRRMNCEKTDVAVGVSRLLINWMYDLLAVPVATIL
jgi:hypothetical protein